MQYAAAASPSQAHPIAAFQLEQVETVIVVGLLALAFSALVLLLLYTHVPFFRDSAAYVGDRFGELMGDFVDWLSTQKTPTVAKQKTQDVPDLVRSLQDLLDQQRARQEKDEGDVNVPIPPGSGDDNEGNCDHINDNLDVDVDMYNSALPDPEQVITIRICFERDANRKFRLVYYPKSIELARLETSAYQYQKAYVRFLNVTPVALTSQAQIFLHSVVLSREQEKEVFDRTGTLGYAYNFFDPKPRRELLQAMGPAVFKSRCQSLGSFDDEFVAVPYVLTRVFRIEEPSTPRIVIWLRDPANSVTFDVAAIDVGAFLETED